MNRPRLVGRTVRIDGKRGGLGHFRFEGVTTRHSKWTPADLRKIRAKNGVGRPI